MDAALRVGTSTLRDDRWLSMDVRLPKPLWARDNCRAPVPVPSPNHSNTECGTSSPSMASHVFSGPVANTVCRPPSVNDLLPTLEVRPDDDVVNVLVVPTVWPLSPIAGPHVLGSTPWLLVLRSGSTAAASVTEGEEPRNAALADVAPAPTGLNASMCAGCEARSLDARYVAGSDCVARTPTPPSLLRPPSTSFSLAMRGSGGELVRVVRPGRARGDSGLAAWLLLRGEVARGSDVRDDAADSRWRRPTCDLGDWKRTPLVPTPRECVLLLSDVLAGAHMVLLIHSWLVLRGRPGAGEPHGEPVNGEFRGVERPEDVTEPSG